MTEEEKLHPEIEALIAADRLTYYMNWKVRRLTGDEAENFMSEMVLDEDVRDLLRQHSVGKQAPTMGTVPGDVLPEIVAHDKRLWRCVAYLCGASLQQIAEYDGVARSTINDTLARKLGRNRQNFRIAGSISDEILELQRRVFKSKINELRSKPPVEIARWLMSNLEEVQRYG